MPFAEQNGIRYYQFDTLNVRHAFFSRRGGVSPNPWNSLNVGGSVGDDIENVRTNRIRSFRALNCEPETMFDVWLVHSTDVVHAETPTTFFTGSCTNMGTQSAKRMNNVISGFSVRMMSAFWYSNSMG